MYNYKQHDPFKLDESFLSDFQEATPPWGYGDLSWVTYKRTYARKRKPTFLFPDRDGEGRESWWETCQRVVEGVKTIQKIHCRQRNLPWEPDKAQRHAQDMYERLFQFKWTPPGRGLWMMGTDFIFERTAAPLNNCFSGDTEFLDGDGNVRSLRDVFQSGDKVNALTADGNQVEATVESYGRQPLQRVTLKPKGLRTNVQLEYDVTPDHRWELEGGGETTDISVGDDVRAPHKPDIQPDPDGFAHGMIFADGTKRPETNTSFHVRLCDEKTECLERLEKSDYFARSYEPDYMDGDVMAVMASDRDLKSTPSGDRSASYIAGFIEGWKYGDGTHDDGTSFSIDTQDRVAANWLTSHAWIAGYAWVGESIDGRATNYGERSAPLHRVKLSRDPYAYRVTDVQDLERREEVYCLEVPEDHSFVLAGGVPTGNCGFTSTKDVDENYAEPFCWAFEMSMLGVGIGFDTRGKGKVVIQSPEESSDVHVIPDSREGWRGALGRLLNAFVGDATLPKEWDYSEIRPKGAPIESFGGVASGPAPLEKMLETLEELYRDHIGQPVDSRMIVDTMNIAGRCVVSGGVRRTAQLSLGSSEDEQFLDLKEDPEKVREYRWASNNSIFADVGMDYSDVAERTGNNGEPGYMWLENARKYGRMKDPPNWDDKEAMGANPCVTGDTLVYTEHGLQPIRNVSDHTKVCQDTRKGESLSAHDGVVSRGMKPVVRVELETGHTLKCTPDHELVTESGKVEAQNLDGDHEVLLTNQLMEIGHGADPDYAESLGFLVGDGYLYEHDDGTVEPRWCFFGDKRDMAETYLKKIDHAESVHDIKGRDETRIQTTRFAVPDEMEHNKLTVPPIVMQGTPDVRGAFLRGLFSADGSVQGGTQKGRSIRLTSVSEALLQDVQRLLASLSIKSTIYQNRHDAGKREMPDGKGGSKMYDCQSIHDLVITRESMKMFQDRVGFSEGSPQKSRLQDILDQGERSLYADKHKAGVKSVERAGKEEVFDVVNTDSTTFVANGMCISNCVEQTLEDRELCTLIETYPTHHDDTGDYLQTLKSAYQYAKTVTLLTTNHEKTNAVMQQNRRIGCSMTGIVQAINKHGYRNFIGMCNDGYDYIQHLDQQYADWLGVPESIKTTSVKPSGTVSTLAGSTPGVHWGHAPYYIRRVRVQDTSELVETCREAGYPVEEDTYADDTYVVSFPVRANNLERKKSEVSLREKLDLAARMQREWADNQVSCTAEFDPETEADRIPRLLEEYEDRLKAISFLPQEDHDYEQMPYETISQDEYYDLLKEIDSISGAVQVEHDREDKFCSGEACKVDPD